MVLPTPSAMIRRRGFLVQKRAFCPTFMIEISDLDSAVGTAVAEASKAEFAITIAGTPDATVTKVATATVSFAKPE